MTNLFKKGDKVVVRSWRNMLKKHRKDGNGNISFDGVVFTENMRKFTKRKATIVAIDKTFNVYALKFDGKKNRSDYYFCDGMLKKAKITSNKFKLKKVIKELKKSKEFDENLL